MRFHIFPDAFLFHIFQRFVVFFWKASLRSFSSIQFILLFVFKWEKRIGLLFAWPGHRLLITQPTNLSFDSTNAWQDRISYFIILKFLLRQVFYLEQNIKLIDTLILHIFSFVLFEARMNLLILSSNVSPWVGNLVVLWPSHGPALAAGRPAIISF